MVELTEKELEKEQWKWIRGYKDLYEISDMGRVKSYQKKKLGAIMKTRRPNLNSNTVHLTNKDGIIASTVRVSHLVLDHFGQGSFSHSRVHYDNDDATDCRLSNISWVKDPLPSEL